MIGASICVGMSSACNRPTSHVPVRQSSIWVVVALVNSTLRAPESQ